VEFYFSALGLPIVLLVLSIIYRRQVNVEVSAGHELVLATVTFDASSIVMRNEFGIGHLLRIDSPESS